jgi:diguanylate cyclase (GGDEF)-like protein/PAS domain S-box-containing protein
MEPKIQAPEGFSAEIASEPNLLHPKYQHLIYKMVVDSASDVIITTSQTGTILYVNRTAEKVFGYGAGELIGENLTLLVPEKYRHSYKARIARYLTSGRHNIQWKPIELPALTRDGRQFPIEISFGEHSADGERMFTAVVRDITGRKQTEESLRQSAQYENLFKHINDAIIIFEPEHEIVLDVNEQACRMYGFTRHEFIGSSLQSISANVENGRKYIDKLLRDEQPELLESVQFHKDGTPLSVLINASVIEFKKQKAVLCITRDITARVKADAALRESEYQLRTLIASMSEGLLHLDNDDRIIFLNKRFCEMTGYTEAELLGQNASHLLLDEEGRQQVEKANERRREGVSETYEIRLRTKDGRTIWSLVGAAPILSADGRMTGSMSIHTDISERKRAEQQLIYNALHDTLTDLPNRALFLEHLRRAMARSPFHQKSFAVLFLDFDGFKLINDSLGHAEGDNLLKLIARRLESLLRGDDIVARLGGDEFTILLNELTLPKDVMTVVERINRLFAEPFLIAGRDVFISASVGIALRDNKYESPEEMLRDADIAMYRAKSAGKARHEIFNQDMREQVNQRLRTETELRLALEREQFAVYYQPIMDLTTNRVIGFEALIRWLHPERGLIFPNDFIPVAEDTGLIIPIGEWVLEEACRQVREWQNAFPEQSDLTVSVNLSCKQFIQHDLARRVAAILRQTGLEPQHLRLEVTESHLMENSEMAITIMNDLRELGVQLSIDDFGTGYSSLSYLQRLPINYLKIDRSFINVMNANQENSEIVKAIVMLAKNLQMDVIAEGIETEDQAARLINLDCNLGQGYLFSKPTAAAEAEALLRAATAFNLPVDDFGLMIGAVN